MGHTSGDRTPCQAEELVAGLPWECRGDDSSPVPSIFISYSYKLPEEAEAWHINTKMPVLTVAQLVFTTSEAKLQYR